MFVRVGNNLTVLHKELEGILRRPKKFICINDEVDYTREDAGVIQSTIREFFELLFPLPSSFELAPNKRNNFRYLHEFREWLVIFSFLVIMICIFTFTYTSLSFQGERCEGLQSGFCHRICDGNADVLLVYRKFDLFLLKN